MALSTILIADYSSWFSHEAELSLLNVLMQQRNSFNFCCRNRADVKKNLVLHFSSFSQHFIFLTRFLSAPYSTISACASWFSFLFFGIYYEITNFVHLYLNLISFWAPIFEFLIELRGFYF